MANMSLMARVIDHLPGGIPAEAIEAVEDGNWEVGWWVYLAKGYRSPATECHTIHEYSLQSLFYEVSCIEEYEED